MSKQSGKFLGILIVLMVAASIYVGCSDDIILEPLPSLLGEYEGRYTITTNYGQANQITEEYLITWRFSDQNYWLYDTTSNLCSPSGFYILADNVTLDEQVDGCAGAVADNAKNPGGVFSIRQPADSVILTQLEDETFKEVLLKKVVQ